jgi:hypothetical protein
MPTNTYDALITVPVTVATPSVTFDLSTITGYTDLIVVFTGSMATNGANMAARINGDSGSNYSGTYLLGTSGNQAISARDANANSLPISVSGTQSTHRITQTTTFMSYANSAIQKTILIRDNNSAGSVGATAALWRNTAAITSVVYFPSTGNISAGSTFSVYGIAAEPVPVAKATGGAITFAADGYTYHAFTSSGTFTPSVALTCDVLTIAAGGGGGANHGGGGGAGGLLYTSASAFSATGFAVTVGAGGAGATFNGSPVGANGTNSSVNSLVATGGGRGGDYSSNYNANNGGSGGGAGANTNDAIGTGINGQGFNGGAKNPNFGLCGGGGGGAGAVGETCLIANSGAGGVGLATYSQWGSATNTGQNVSGVRYFAGGGAGGGWNGAVPVGTFALGGLGGGGQSGPVVSGGTSNGTAGTANTGGGGGCGGGGSSNGGAGGSGIVIIRYQSA